ncbi:MAG: F0F1 ATP synthase subunit B [Gammaproteobacteria bacterium]|nr:F0F1 ATP synthase subunit B [Gammaproteobacteria bacterium]MCH9745021.1 F0F1 ATP synthase subunit B [Gammaproteobacteria bacterium]
MDINITLIGQMITFAVFVWFTMKFVWPPLMGIMDDRRKKIADGLAAAEKGHDELELAQHKVKEQLIEAKAQAASIVEKANQRSNTIIEEAKGKARHEGERLLKIAQDEIAQEYNSARESLMKNASEVAMMGAEKILQREINSDNNDWLMKELAKEI